MWCCEDKLNRKTAYFRLPSVAQKRCMLKLANERPERDANPDFCDAGAVLHQLRYQANCELVIMWVYDKPVDSGYMSFNS